MRSHTVDAYIGLGSNSPDAHARLTATVQAFAGLPGVRVGAVSRWYWTNPQEMPQESWFLNGAVRLCCGAFWSGPGLLRALLRIEARLGRRRSPHPARQYSPRAIDIDVLCFGTQRHHTPTCILPHPRMLLRAFVCIPLREITPQGILPDGTRLDTALSRVRYTLHGNSIRQ